MENNSLLTEKLAEGNLTLKDILEEQNEILPIEFFALLTSKEEQFKVLAPYFLKEIMTHLNGPQAKEIYKELQRDSNMFSNVQTLYSTLVSNLEDENILEELSLSDLQIGFLKELISEVYNKIIEGVKEVGFVAVPIEILSEDAKIPQYANAGDAGLDLYAVEDVVLNPGEVKTIKTDLKIAIPEGYEMQIRPKSGRSLKTKMRVANSVGTIDSGYRGEVMVIMENIEPSIKDIEYEFDENGKPIILSILHGNSHTINKGEKFAQMILSKVEKCNFVKVKEITSIGNDRGGGFGSSGLK